MSTHRLLEAIIREVLEANDGYCMDVAEEREALALALISALRVAIPDLIADEPDEPNVYLFTQ